MVNRAVGTIPFLSVQSSFHFGGGRHSQVRPPAVRVAQSRPSRLSFVLGGHRLVRLPLLRALDSWGRLKRPLGYAWVILMPGMLSAQVASEIGGEVQCPACTIKLEHLVTLGENDGKGSMPGFPLEVKQDSRSRIYVLLAMPSEPLVFTITGEFLGAIKAKPSDGDGFQWPSRMSVLPGDSLVFFDPRAQKAFFVSPDHHVLNGFPLPNIDLMSAKWVGGSDWIVSGAVSTPSRVGLPLHFLEHTPSGMEFGLSFGSDQGELLPGQTYLLSRAIAAGPGSSFWTGRTYEYVLELWTIGGEKAKELRRSPQWFPGVTRAYPPPPNNEPKPFLRSIWHDPAGLLWCFLWIPRPDWSAVSNKRLGGEIDWNGLYRTVIEVIDPEAARIVASHYWDGTVLRMLDDGVLAALRQSPEGKYFVDIWQVTLTDPNKRR